MAALDPDNPVVKLCLAGMRAEGDGRLGEERDLFAQAWAAQRDDFEARIAAHYLARQQATPEDTLRWNEEALRRAEAVGDARVDGFYASLYLNLGHAHEVLGHPAKATGFYDQAAERLNELPDDRYGAMVRGGIEHGQRRVSGNNAPD